MVSFYSSVDPIFFLHHANLDRLWDVWNRRQMAQGRPSLPQGADLTRWSDEQFLFFSNEKGQPVSKTKAGEYTTMAAFEYDYSPGSGEDQVAGPAVAAAAPNLFSGQISPASAALGAASGAVVQVPSTALQTTSPTATAPVAEITLNLTEADVGRRFRVLVSPGGGAAPVAAGAITVFGHPHHGPATFSVPLPENLGVSAAAAGNVPLDIRVVPIGPAVGPSPAAAVTTAPEVSAVQIRTN